MIFLFFKPLALKKQTFTDVPQLELKDFIMYEFSPIGLETYMIGSNGIKYKNRFIVKDINYTDKSKGYLANMKADDGLYRGNTITLNGNVIYTRNKDFKFYTQKLLYNKKSSVAISNVGYTAYFNDNVVKGSYIRYNNRLNIVHSKNIDASYKLKERKK